MASTTFQLPADFLAGKGPKVEVQRVDFAKTPLPENKELWAVVLDNVLTKEECDMLVQAAEAHNKGQWERAMVNIGGGEQMMITDTRNCGRIIWDNSELVDKIWARCSEHVPEVRKLEAWPKVTGVGPTKRQEIWEMTRLNERMRFLKYTTGEYFKRKSDSKFS